ncbi:hypothetical protein PAXRUDRAFT_145374, partial [Paxillus rubicundulus Ve08.2h10]
ENNHERLDTQNLAREQNSTTIGSKITPLPTHSVTVSDEMMNGLQVGFVPQSVG